VGGVTTFALAGFGFRAATFHRVAQPHLLALAIEQAADTGRQITTTTTTEAWAAG
jgi:hypothetical protein